MLMHGWCKSFPICWKPILVPSILEQLNKDSIKYYVRKEGRGIRFRRFCARVRMAKEVGGSKINGVHIRLFITLYQHNTHPIAFDNIT